MIAKLNVQITDLGYAQIVEHLDKVSPELFLESSYLSVVQL